MRVCLHIGALSCCALLTACFPYHVTYPARSGTVVDLSSQKPIQGAEVMQRGHTNTTVVTDAEGKFQLSAYRDRWWVTPLLPVDYPNPAFHPLEVHAPSYKPQIYYPTVASNSPPIHIELVPNNAVEPTRALSGARGSP
jgi:hypothetical protein